MAHSPLRIAFIGAGDHAQRAHAKHLVNIPGVEIAGAFDPADGAHDELASTYSRPLTRYNSEASVFEDKTVDAVLIASPDRFHLQQLETAVDNGKHVFCEKPMCNSISELPRLQQAFDTAHEKGLVITSCHPRHFDPPYVWLKSNLPHLTQNYGAPISLQLDFSYHKPSKTGLHGGSMLQDHMNHEFDYLNFLFGTASVTAHKLLDEEDRYHVAGVRDDGIAFLFGGTRRLDNSTYGETITLRLERATIHIDTYNPQNSYIHDHERPKQALITNTAPDKTDYDVRFRAINDNWVAAMANRTTNYLSPPTMMANSYMSIAFKDQPSVRFDF